MKNLIIPAAGQSSRFNTEKPKWMLTHPDGNLMIIKSIQGLNLNFFDKIYFVFLKEHIDKFNCLDKLKETICSFVDKNKIFFTILEKPTNSQPETIYEAIKLNNIDGFLAVKDCDNYFLCNFNENNSISVCDLHDIQVENISNKSYVKLDINKNIVNIAEKNIISSIFCTGAYSFKSSKDFINYYEKIIKIEKFESLYISHIIMNMIMDNHNFIPIKTENYVDWGTIDDWNKFKKEYQTIFIDIDGVLFKNSSEYFEPFWGESEPIIENINFIKKIYDSGKTQIIITTSRKKEYKDITLKQLEKYGIKYDEIIFNLNHCKRIIVNDFANTNHYRSCDSINLKRNDNNLESYFK